ncbi:G-protein coupled receptors family 1 profile domain-containing protein [Caenorhabditis elegans]|uniref:G-protein coupled receptors family 1 profile domain-containing protein n=1 Tax=Caenorhabditis elegans TaxID=6239 RepID=Q22450_CAEEL|nr:G-protein coupled receptors family 1 profile domain-containing protein [Caenorhabditis elegans]CCD72065.1 G-protein coupled receptors family 1 profile domain-containing protein [Caenorhabditis elegans]|eukprot:NP_500955.1 Serpentine Receptor, class V [Caenorhabditis elegans]
MPDVLEPPQWPLFVFYGMSIVSLPLYILVFACLLRLRCVSNTYNTTFYSILLQHCIADLLAMLVFFVAVDARSYSFLKEFYFEYQHYYVAAASYNNIYYFLYIRCTGIIFLSLQRYLIITAPTSRITHKVQNASKLQIITVYWSVPTIISIVVLKDYKFSYDNLEAMSIIAEQDVIKRNTLMALIVVSLTCILCSVLYGSLFYYIRKHTAGLSRSLRREVHLAFQVFVLLLAFFAILVYYSFQNYFSQTQNTGPIFYMRALYPIANGLLSYINPFCILFLNKDLAFQVTKSLTCSKLKVSEVHVSVIPSNSNKQSDGHRKVIHLKPARMEESTTVHPNQVFL